ncbi:MAG: Rrf2 family transcriptional regulator [Gammaproteobacteria bacterium]
MRLNSFTDYSLRVLMYLATEPDRRATIAEIAAAFEISRNHLMKVVQFLGQQGWLHNVRGRGGGLELACPPERINLGAVVRAAEGDPLPAECFDRAHNTCAIARTCKLRGVLGEAVDAFHAVLDGYTLADITQDMRPLGQVLKVVQRGLRDPGGRRS